MRELKLRYIIDLVSNVAANAKKDEDALVKAQAAMQKELSGTDVKLGMVTRGLMRMNGVSHAGIERQAQYLTTLANNALKATQRIENLGKSIVTVGKVGMALGAGTWAAGRFLQGSAQATMSYDMVLADMANTAFNDIKSKAGRQAGMKVLERGINAAQEYGGGTREEGAEAANTMIASGLVKADDALKMLPGIMKTATASRSNANELATIAIRARQSFGIKAEEVEGILSGAMVGGQEGGFEVRDMAKWLPQQMPMAAKIGIREKQGFARLVAMNQGAVITAGTKDEAGTNLKDMLSEMATPHFRDHMAKFVLNNGKPLKKGERYKMQKDIDQMFLEYQARGVNKVDATIDMIEKKMAQKPEYVMLKKRLLQLEDQLAKTDPTDKEAKTKVLDEKRRNVAAMLAQVEGVGLGIVFGNQQSMLGYLGVSTNRQYVGGIDKKVFDESGRPVGSNEAALSHSVIADTAGYKMLMAKEAEKRNEKAAMDQLTPTIGKVADAFTELSAKNSLLVGTTMLATGALASFASTAGMMALLMGGGMLSRLGGRAAGLLGRGAAVVGGASWLGGAATAGVAGYAAGSAMGLGIDKLIQNATGQKDATLGTFLYDKFNPSPIQAPRADLAARVRANAGNMKPVDPVSFITLTAPKQGPQQMATGRNTEVKVGEGRIAVDVRITDQRTQTSATVVQQPNLVKLNAGATNPGSTGSW